MNALPLMVALLASPSASLPDTPACPPISELPALACEATANGWFYAATPEAATGAAQAGKLAADRFLLHFGQAAPVGASVISSEFPKVQQKQFAELHSLPYVKVWVPVDAAATLLEQSLRKLKPDLADDKVKAMVQRTMESGSLGRDELSHEIGHALYNTAFWSQAQEDMSQYGTSAPDWLEEAAAILMEPDSMLGDRRNQFRNLQQQNSPLIHPLAEFLGSTHPVTSGTRIAQLSAQHGGQTNSGAMMAGISGQAAQAVMAFYLQSLAVADFMIERSGQQDVLGDISRALANGMTFEQWLAKEGAQHQLGSNMSELESNWTEWLETQGKTTSAA